MNSVKSAVFEFENFDSVTIESKNIGGFELDGITTIIRRITLNAITKYQSPKNFFIEIKNDANILENTENYGTRYVFDRLMQHRDITGIELIYEDGQTERYLFPFDSNEYYEDNKLESFRQNKFGDLYIAIGEDFNVNDIITEEVLNMQDDEKRELKWKYIC